MLSGLILGIETSCDETAAAVVHHGTETLSSVVASQIDLHARYGGVVPELASREHLRNIVPVVREAITLAGISFADLDAIAVTSGPGLAGALLVGITYAKSLAFALAKPLLAVNHLEGHIFAVLMQHATTLLPPPETPNTHIQKSVPSTAAQRSAETCSSTSKEFVILTEAKRSGETCSSQLPPEPSFPEPSLPLVSTPSPKNFSPPSAPLIALVVSGGHTHLYRADRDPATQTLHYQTLGRTVDDAAGEAFDKVAKLLGLPYPGGPWIDALAPFGNPRAIPFRFAAIHPRNPIPTSITVSSRPERSEVERPAVPTPIPSFNPPHEAGAVSPIETMTVPSSWVGSSGGAPGKPREASARAASTNLDFSFSGIKTAVLRHLQAHHLLAAADARRAKIPQTARPTPDLITTVRAQNLLPPDLLDLAASFQHAVVGRLLKQTFAAVDQTGARSVLVTGGVAANAELRRRFSAEAQRRALPIAFPTLALSTDNAAMIAAAAWPRLLAGDLAPQTTTDTLTATPQLRLDSTPSQHRPQPAIR